MSVRAQRGFTLIEVMLAVVLLTMGVMALVSSSALTARMIGRGRSSTVIAQRASSRFDNLRQLAASTSPACTPPLTGGTYTNPTDHIQETWTISTPASSPNARLVTLIMRSKARGRTVADTAMTLILCK